MLGTARAGHTLPAGPRTQRHLACRPEDPETFAPICAQVHQIRNVARHPSHIYRSTPAESRSCDAGPSPKNALSRPFAHEIHPCQHDNQCCRVQCQYGTRKMPQNARGSTAKVHWKRPSNSRTCSHNQGVPTQSRGVPIQSQTVPIHGRGPQCCHRYHRASDAED